MSELPIFEHVLIVGKSKGKTQVIFQAKMFLLNCSTDAKYQCKYCNKRFGSPGQARQHESLHEAPKFSCKHCGKKLKSEDTLKMHERYHTGEKPFECSECGAGFTGRGRLAQHMRGVHKLTGRGGGKPGWRKSKAKSRE